jgi:DNA mismatch endonuclease (patch repair protein)
VADVFGKRKRSAIMAAIRAKHTTPEIAVAVALRRLRIPFRRHVKALPGKPDFVLGSEHIALFVHGCFWHQHAGCNRLAVPKTNRAYWIPKLERNVSRFATTRSDLRRNGWKTVVVWECETKSEERLLKRLNRRLGGNLRAQG